MAAAGGLRDGGLARRAVPGRGRTGRGQDRPGAPRRAPAAAHAVDRPHRRHLPDGAVDAPVGGGRGADGAAAGARRGEPAPAVGLRRRRRHVRARRAVGRALGQAVLAWDVRDCRRGASPRRRACVGAGLQRGVRRRRALAAALRHAVSLRCGADPGRALRQRRHRGAGRHVLLCGRRARRRLPAGHVRALRRRAPVAVGRGDDRGVVRGRRPLARGRTALPHRDQRRARRRASAHPRRGPREAALDSRGRPPRRGWPCGRRGRRARARGREGAARGDR